MAPDLQFNILLSFYRTREGTHLSTVRLTDSAGSIPDSGNWPLATTVPTHHPFSFATDAPSYTRMMWSSDMQAQGVYVVQPGENPAVALFVGFSQDTLTPPGTPPAPTPVAQVPAWPVPTTTGAVSDSGSAVVMTIAGNATQLSFTTVPGWIPFESVARASYSQVRY
jgi:hypothetical protein